MVVDSSAVLAVLLGEPDAELYATAIGTAGSPAMSAISVLESTIVIGSRKREKGLAILESFLRAGRIRIVTFDQAQLAIAKSAWWMYGKGRHPAGLNLGDCCSYALAKASGEPLLYKGTDFRSTDLGRLAVP